MRSIKLMLLLAFLLVGAAAFGQTVVTKNYRGKKTKVFVSSQGQALLWYPSLIEAKKFYATKPPADGFIIVTKWYNFWSYNATTGKWKQIQRKP